MKYDYYYALEGLQLTEHVFYDIEFLLLKPWWEPKILFINKYDQIIDITNLV